MKNLVDQETVKKRQRFMSDNFNRQSIDDKKTNSELDLKRINSRSQEKFNIESERSDKNIISLNDLKKNILKNGNYSDVTLSSQSTASNFMEFASSHDLSLKVAEIKKIENKFSKMNFLEYIEENEQFSSLNSSVDENTSSYSDSSQSSLLELKTLEEHEIPKHQIDITNSEGDKNFIFSLSNKNNNFIHTDKIISKLKSLQQMFNKNKIIFDIPYMIKATLSKSTNLSCKFMGA
jgi:hypothetical protein